MIRTYVLQRDTDATGISGTGEVAEVAVFSDGSCTMHWLREPTSWATYRNAADLLAIHGHGGATTLVATDLLPRQRVK